MLNSAYASPTNLDDIIRIIISTMYVYRNITQLLIIDVVKVPFKNNNSRSNDEALSFQI